MNASFGLIHCIFSLAHLPIKGSVLAEDALAYCIICACVEISIVSCLLFLIHTILLERAHAPIFFNHKKIFGKKEIACVCVLLVLCIAYFSISSACSLRHKTNKLMVIQILTLFRYVVTEVMPVR